MRLHASKSNVILAIRERTAVAVMQVITRALSKSYRKGQQGCVGLSRYVVAFALSPQKCPSTLVLSSIQHFSLLILAEPPPYPHHNRSILG